MRVLLLDFHRGWGGQTANVLLLARFTRERHRSQMLN